tara:strand:+ start:448 stop:876 length:429 start_codon:yes stop_codon:yes gene_type:complete
MAHHVTKRIHEVITLASNAKTKDEKITILRQNVSQGLKDVLVGAYHSKVDWNLPNGVPPFEAAEERSVPTNLLKQTRKFNDLIKGGPGDTLPAFKRERIFIRLIEMVHPDDAELLLKMVAKKQLAKGITKKLVEEAFPGLIN